MPIKMKKIIKIISNTKDWLVKDNFGLHAFLAYVIFDMISVYNTILAFSTLMLGITLMEFYDKFVLKTKFSWKDLIAGLIGTVVAYLVNIM